MRDERRYSDCPGSVSGHDDGDRYGHCTWCGKKVSAVVPRPTSFNGRSQIDEAYGYFYDPDFTR